MRKLSWVIQVSPKGHHKGGIKRFDTQRSPMKTEAETGAKDTKECWQPAEARRGQGQLLPRAPGGSTLLLTPWFLASEDERE